MTQPHLTSARIGQCFLETDRGRDRIEYTEYGSGEAWVVLLPPLFVPRTAHDRLAHALASAGLHVVVPDLLGHGRSDRPQDPMAYSVTAFAEQVVALLDHLGAAQAVVGGTGLGANVALETAAHAPHRVRGMLLDGPVLDDAMAAGLAVLGPVMYAARFAPVGVHAVRMLVRPVPRRLVPDTVGLVLDTVEHRPGPLAALVHGVLFGRLAPTVAERTRLEVPALVIARPGDPLHRASDAVALAEELPAASLEEAAGRFEWHRSPERLDLAVTRFALDCSRQRGIRRTRRSTV